MRKVTKQVCRAFVNGESKTIGNTSTDGQHLWLHGNLIAAKTEDKCIQVTMAGWPTVTTRERLNGLIDLLSWDNDQWRHRPVDRFSQRDWCQYYGDEAVSEYDWIDIGRWDFLPDNYPF